MTDAQKIARFIAQKGVTKCPTVALIITTATLPQSTVLRERWEQREALRAEAHSLPPSRHRDELFKKAGR